MMKNRKLKERGNISKKTKIKSKLEIKTIKKGKVVEIKKVKLKKQRNRKTLRGKDKLNKIWVEVLLKDPQLRRWLVQEIGEYVIHVIKNFDGYVSDEDLAKKCEIKPSEVRVVLNRLHAKGFVEYIRKKDKKNSWYSYIWYLKPTAAEKFYEGFKKIKEEVSTPQTEDQELYYVEVNGKIKYYTFEQAFENRFKCPETGKPLKYLNRNK